MKLKLLAAFMSVIMLAAFAMPVCCFAEGSGEAGEELILKNEKFTFVLNKQNGCFRITDLKNNTYYSNPLDNDSLNSEYLYSQLSLEYYTESHQLVTLNSYEHSAKLGNMQAELKDGKIHVNYIFGKFNINRSMIPNSYTKKEFKDIISNSHLTKSLFEDCYSLIEKDSDKYKELKESYKLLADQSLYILNKYAPDYKIEKIYKELREIGFTADDLEKHNKKHGVETEKNTNISISIPLVYELDENGFTANISCKAIDISGNIFLTKLKLLPFYEAGFNTEEGYMLLPDGGGALIEFSNNRNSLEDVVIPVYGDDEAITQSRKTSYFERCIMPIFGIKHANKATLAVIEKGDAISKIQGSISRNDIPVCTVFSAFDVTAYEMITLDSVSSKSSYNVYSPERYSGDISVRYILLDGDNANYSAMAAQYRSYLLENNMLPNRKTEKYPISVELLGAIAKKKKLLGISYNKYYPLTTFDDAIGFINNLNTDVSKDIILKYNGWCNSGLSQGYLSDIKPISVLGNKKDYRSFNKTVSMFDIKCYYGVYLQQINEKLINGKINILKNASKCIYKDVAMLSRFNLATFLPLDKKAFETDILEAQSYMLSPSKLKGLFKNTLKKGKSLSVKSYCYEDLGSMLYSNFSEKDFYNRQDSLEVISGLLNGSEDFSVTGGDIYSLKNSSHIYDMPLASSERLIYDAQVPFAQMVLHGYISYSGEAINLSDDPTVALLKSVETGAVLHYTFAFRNAEQLKNSAYNNYYSVNYSTWSDSIEENYRKISVFQKELSSKTIAEHNILNENVTETVYEGGARVVVNYGNTDFEYESVIVPAKDYCCFSKDGGIAE